MDELAVYMHGSELDDKAVPILVKSLSILGLPLTKVPNKIVFRSRWSVPGYNPDETMSLLSIKKDNPNVEFRKLERLYKNDMLSKYLWEENFSAEDINWRELLILCNCLVERSATDFDVFLKFSLMGEEALELITN
ncbi:hypothetical protein OAQ37_02300 [Alphaproteobacteria bacterium]|nr:hypothetical protein [Alphaproteobacteria bacterium]